jgi:hypothetical protein
VKAAFAHARLLVDILSMKVFVCLFWLLLLLRIEHQLLDSHLFYFDRYSALADYHRRSGRIAKADRLAAVAEAYKQAAAPDDDPDDEPPNAAAMAMVLTPRITHTNAVSTQRLKTSSSRGPLAPSG